MVIQFQNNPTKVQWSTFKTLCLFSSFLFHYKTFTKYKTHNLQAQNTSQNFYMA